MIKIQSQVSIENYCGRYSFLRDWSPPRTHGSNPYGYIVSDEYHPSANINNHIQKKEITDFSTANNDALVFELINIKAQCKSEDKMIEEIVNFCNKYGLLDSPCLQLDEKIKALPSLVYTASKATASRTADEKLAGYKDYMSVEKFLSIQDYLEHMVRLLYFLKQDHLNDVCDFLNTIFYFLFRTRGQLNFETTPSQRLVHDINIAGTSISDGLREILDDHRSKLPEVSSESDFPQVVNIRLPQYQEYFLGFLDWLDKHGLLDDNHLSSPTTNILNPCEERTLQGGLFRLDDIFFSHHIECSQDDLILIKEVARNIFCEELNKELAKVPLEITHETGTFKTILPGESLYRLFLQELRTLATHDAQVLLCKRTDCMCYFSSANKKRQQFYCNDRCKWCQTRRDRNANPKIL